jgi:hypothetical protein
VSEVEVFGRPSTPQVLNNRVLTEALPRMYAEYGRARAKHGGATREPCLESHPQEPI